MRALVGEPRPFVVRVGGTDAEHARVAGRVHHLTGAFVARGGDQGHTCAVRIVDRGGLKLVGRVGAKGHVDHVGAVVDGPDDALGDVVGVPNPVGVQHLDGQDSGVGGDTHNSGTVGLTRDHAREERPVAVVVGLRTRLVGDGVETLGDPARQVRVRGLDAGVQNGHRDIGAGAALPQVLGLHPVQTPLQVAALVIGGQRHRVGLARGVHGQDGVVGGLLGQRGRVRRGRHLNGTVIGLDDCGEPLSRGRRRRDLGTEGGNLRQFDVKRLDRGEVGGDAGSIGGHGLLCCSRHQRRHHKRHGGQPNGDTASLHSPPFLTHSL